MTFEIKQGDTAYPKQLQTIPDPPPRLFGIGKVNVLNEAPAIAIVGARECTPYGKRIAYQLARDLAREGVIIVSGMAYGIDAEAHRGTLAAFGRTIAVLGCGIDVPYPSEHQRLKKEIAVEGTVITEMEAGAQASRWSFPRRNRIISGLSLGVVVVEAGIKSGSLITADLALEQGRDVFAVPGPIESKLSQGTHRLIQNGAKLVTKASDILDEIPWNERTQAVLSIPVAKKEKGRGEGDQVLDFLSHEPKHLDEIVLLSGVSVEKMSPLLVSLEIEGKISSLPGGRFIRN